MFSSINLDTVKEHLDKFVALDSDKDGCISLEDFALYYKLPTSSAVKELFSIFDRVSFLDNTLLKIIIVNNSFNLVLTLAS